jgi:trans-2,3-dihydro-3-hydroxyanthranilate isomerase
MRVPFRLVDVFTDRPLAGNQLCVVPDPDVVRGISPELMQAIALEIGFSETTFVTGAERNRYSMRIFTPGTELPFAGHPTLGTAFVLVSEGRVVSPATQEVAAGEFSVEADPAARTAWMRQHAARFGPPVDDLNDIAAAVGLPREDLHPEMKPAVVDTGLGHLMVPAGSGDAVARATLNESALRQVLRTAGADGLYLFAMLGEGRAKARMFAGDVGITEDPATGSAAGPLGAYVARAGLLPSGRLTISQGEEVGRPSTLLVAVESEGDTWRPSVGGGVQVVGKGAFDFPG